MTKIILTVNGAKARAAVSGPLTSGMTGIPVTIEYDEAWDGLTKTLVCRCGQWGPDRGETRMMGSIEDAAVVAHEVMKPDMHLYLGVEGYSDDGKLVIPSTWADCGRIQYGANAQADPSTDPALPVWAQLQSEIRQLRDEGMTEERVISIIDAYQNNNSGQVPGGDQNTGQTASHLSGKYLSLLGDSISTYPGYIPEGYSCYYAENFMNSVTYMWWHRLMTALGMNLCVNNAYSGSCVAVKAGVADGYSGCQTVRNMRLHTGTTVPDMIIVQMGTNDYVQKVPIGDYDLDDGEVFDTSTFMGAYAKMLWNISSKYPNTKLYCATLLKMRNVRDTAYPVSGMEAYNDAIRRVADLFGAGIIDFSACGITPSNVPNYMVDSRIHPNKDGQALMGNQAIAEIAPYFATRYGVLPPAINNDAALDDGDEGGSGGSSGETEVTLTKISVVYSVSAQ